VAESVVEASKLMPIYFYHAMPSPLATPASA
jgi:hypothetical protein